MLSNIKKLKGDPLAMEKFEEKSLTMPKKTEGGDPLSFLNMYAVAKHEKTERGLWQKKIENKVSQCRKKLKGV